MSLYGVVQASSVQVPKNWGLVQSRSKDFLDCTWTRLDGSSPDWFIAGLVESLANIRLQEFDSVMLGRRAHFDVFSLDHYVDRNSGLLPKIIDRGPNGPRGTHTPSTTTLNAWFCQAFSFLGGSRVLLWLHSIPFVCVRLLLQVYLVVLKLSLPLSIDFNR